MTVKSKRIIIFGFSGSGKSTVANLVGKKTGLRVIHSSGILRDLYEKKKLDLSKTRYARGFWETKKGLLFLKKRLNEERPLDLVLDKILIKELSKGNIVVDCWSMPWLFSGGLKIYLRTSSSERAKRVSIRGKINLFEAARNIKTKDEDTRRLIKKFYDLDIKKQLNVFDLVIDTDKLTKTEVADIIVGHLNLA